jgi:predicted dienelactone hydrolase
VPRLRVAAACAVLALAATACASATSTAAESRSTTTTSTRPSATPDATAFTHVQLPFEDTSRPAVDPIAVRSAPTRQLPTELYLPDSGGRRPLIVFAHGYNGDPSKFGQLFTAWAEAGFAVLAPRFPITYTGASDGPLGRAADIAQQPADVSYVLDRLLAGEYGNRIDRARIGVAGLSLGGGTTWGLISDRCCVEQRFRAAVIMDGNRFGFGDATHVRNTIPVMVFHIRTDIALPYAAARQAYAQASAPKYFVTIFEGVHPEPFEDIPHPADEMVRQSTIDFFRAYLLGDAKARSEIVATATAAGISEVEADTGK